MFRVCGRRVLARHVARIGAFVFALTLIGAQHAAAQAVYGSIAGTVTDESGAVLPGVTVTVTSVERKTVDTVVTNESGHFSKERLLPGNYEVKAELSGFKTAVVPSRAGERRYPDADRLEAGRRSADRDGRGHRRIAAAQDRSRRRVDDLRPAAADRSAGARSELHQVHPAHARARSSSPGSTPRRRTRRVPRRRWSTARASAGPAISSMAPKTAIRFWGSSSSTRTSKRSAKPKITSQNYDAEFGQATAGVVSVQTKSGTNEFHGSGFEFFQNDTFQARNPFTQPSKDSLPETKRNQFGVRRWRADHEEQVVLLRRLPGHAQHGGRLAAVVGADRRWRARATSASTASTSTTRRAAATPPRGRSFAGAVIPGDRLSPQALAHPEADSEAESAGPRERDAGQLPGVGQSRPSTRISIDGRDRPPAERVDQHLRPLQLRQVLPQRPDGVRHGRRRGTGQPRRRFGREEPEPGARR